MSQLISNVIRTIPQADGQVQFSGVFHNCVNFAADDLVHLTLCKHATLYAQNHKSIYLCHCFWPSPQHFYTLDQL